MLKVFISPWLCIMQTSCNFKSHYYRLVPFSINIDENRGNHTNYECTKAYHARCSLLSPNLNQTWISQQIIVITLILNCIKNISNIPRFKICQQKLVKPLILKFDKNISITPDIKICQQILLTHLILNLSTNINNTPDIKICQQILITPSTLKFVNKY
jgi:hypothetical protein